MTTESFLEKRLQRFTVLDISLIKCVYFLVGLLVASLYPELVDLSFGFYLILCIFCAMPVYVRLFSQSGPLVSKIKSYLKTNNLSNQMLLFLATLFFALMVAALMPVITEYPWWGYVLAMVILAIKPLKTSWVW